MLWATAVCARRLAENGTASAEAALSPAPGEEKVSCFHGNFVGFLVILEKSIQ